MTNLIKTIFKLQEISFGEQCKAASAEFRKEYPRPLISSTVDANPHLLPHERQAELMKLNLIKK